ncbi:hypothetical protein GGR30_000245 [Martelella radicis]|uniref:IstB-like ATP-binding domain-containing protein n=1 Tax=Martelella radicis TaxID=1397476 RepID=A0A7W6KI47_9HYPH|nr:hypothetical protein [Martelella radicis]
MPRSERSLLRFQKQMAAYKLLIIDELGFVPLSKSGAELLFELISQRYERGATLLLWTLRLSQIATSPGGSVGASETVQNFVPWRECQPHMRDWMLMPAAIRSAFVCFLR